MRARFVVDWDDTLVEDRWPDQGPWLPGAVEALHALNRLGDVVIFSCRVSDYAFPSRKAWHDDVLRPSHEVDREVNRMREMLRAEGLGHIEIWQRGYKPAATVYIDNKAIRFTGNWDETLDDMLDVISVPLERRAPTVEKSPLDRMTITGWTPPTRHNVGTRVKARKEYVESMTGRKVPVGGLGTVEEPNDLSQSGESLVRFDAIPDNRFYCKYEDLEAVAHPAKPIPYEEFLVVDETHTFPLLPDQDLTPWMGIVTTAGPERHPNSARFHELLQEAGELHDKKQADYGRGDDPFSNVRGSEEWGITGWLGAMVRATDKVRRLQTFAVKGELANEAVVDAFMDLAVYALIARVLYEEGLEQPSKIDAYIDRMLGLS